MGKQIKKPDLDNMPELLEAANNLIKGIKFSSVRQADECKEKYMLVKAGGTADFYVNISALSGEKVDLIGISNITGTPYKFIQ